ncbi:MAG TPA: zinc ribbon domain-containing protein [Solirubrobacteraceae bacterium]
MSGLLERIVRRRRASASSRLGPPTQHGHPSPFEVPYLNGHETALPVMHVNGDAGVVEVAEPAGVAEPVAVPAEVEAEAVEVIEVMEVPEDVVPREAVEVPEAIEAPEAAEVPEAEPEVVEVPEDVVPPEAIEVPEAIEAPEEDELDAPAPIDDESPTMEHRVLVLDEPEDDEALEPEPAPVVADEPEPEPADPPAPEPRFRERGRIRRRARYLRRLREVQLRDIGGFMLELHRFGRERPDLIQAKIAGAAQTDAELRALDQALGAEEPLRELREAGIGGVCNNCGAVHGSEDRFCATCGEPLGRNSHAPGHSSEFGTFFTQG